MLNVEVKVDHRIHDICAATKVFYHMTNYWERKKQIPFLGGNLGEPWSPRFYPFSQTTSFIINIIVGGA